MATSVVRVNVSVPAELKARMDRHGGDTNWSKVAGQAFELALAQIASRTKEAKTMADVLARLKKAGEVESSEALQAARERGRWWAMNVATPKQFRRLEDHVQILASRGGGPFDGQPMHPWGHSALLAFAVCGGKPSEEVATRFWAEDVKLDDELMSKLEDSEFLETFVDASLEVWAEVEDKL